MLNVDQPGTTGGSARPGDPLVLVEVLADEAGRVARLLQPHVEGALGVAVGVEGRPAAERRRAAGSEVLVRTPVWWGYCPVKKLDRETQHSESVTKECGYDAPVAAHPLHRPHRLQRGPSRSRRARRATMLGRVRPAGRRARARRPRSAPRPRGRRRRPAAPPGRAGTAVSASRHSARPALALQIVARLPVDCPDRSGSAHRW